MVAAPGPDALYQRVLDGAREKDLRLKAFQAYVRVGEPETFGSLFDKLIEQSLTDTSEKKLDTLLDHIAKKRYTSVTVPDSVWESFELAFRKRLKVILRDPAVKPELLDKFIGLSWVLPRPQRVALLTDIAFSVPLVAEGKPFNQTHAAVTKSVFYELSALKEETALLKPHIPKLVSTLEDMDDHIYPGAVFHILAGLKRPELDERMFDALVGKDPKILRQTAAKYLSLRPDLSERALPIALDLLKNPSGIPSVDLLALVEAVRGNGKVGERRKIDEALRKAFPLPEVKADACEVVCALVDKVNEWGDVGTDPIWGAKRSGDWGKQVMSEEAAVRSLGALFMVKAAPYCPKAKKFAKEWAGKLRSDGGWMGVSSLTSEKKAAERTEQENADLLRALSGATVPDEAFLRAQNFINSITDRSAPTHYSELYGKIFFSLALSELRDSGEIPYSLADPMLAVTETALRKETGKFQAALSTHSGSFFNTYGLSSAVLATYSPPTGPLQRLREMSSQLDDPRAVPYRPELGTPAKDRPKKTAEELESAFRSAAGRAVIFHLALYRDARGKTEKSMRLADLNAALENHLSYSHTLRLHAIRETTKYLPSFYHLEPDRLAPYYYYPTVPYATAAIRTRLQDADISPEEKRSLLEKRAKLQDDLLAMMKADGMFRSEFTGLPHHPSKTYDNPLAGLAILPLIDTCDGKPVPPSYGILRTPGSPAPLGTEGESILVEGTHGSRVPVRPVSRFLDREQ